MRLACLLPVLLCFAAAAHAAEPNPYLAQARQLYTELEYERCLSRLEQASHWRGTERRELTEIELYQGLCQANLGHTDAAAEHFQQALRLDPQVQLPPLTSPKLEKLFRSVAKRMPRPAPASADSPPALARDVPPAQSPALAPSPAAALATPSPVSPAPAPRRIWVLPVGLAAGSLALAGGGIAFGVQADHLAQRANAAPDEPTHTRLAQQARRDATIANVGYGAAAVALTAAVFTWWWTSR